MPPCVISLLIGLQVGCSGAVVETLLSYGIWRIPVLSCRWSFGLCWGCCVSGTVQPRVEAGSNTSTVPLRVVGGDRKGTQFLGVKPGDPVPGGYKYGDLAFQVGGVSNMVMSPAGLGPENDYAGEGQQQL
jgi:hypothetical protein